MKNYEKRLKMQVVRREDGKFELINIIDLDESYFTKFLEIYQNIEYKDKEILDGIIKVFLNESEGLEQLKNGIIYKGHKFNEIITSPSGMKQQEEKYKCQSIFYDTEKYPNLKEEFYNIISAGRLETLKGENIAINKKVSSRLALATSSIVGNIDIDVNRIFVAPEYEYTYLNNYSWFENGKLIEGKKELTHTFSDGQGLMSNEVAERIRVGLNKEHRIDFAGVRLYGGLAAKGILLRYDFKSYYRSQGIEVIKDVYENDWNIDDIDIIVNPSMVKWLDLHSNIKDTIEYYENSAYKEINSKLYITKINKAPEDVKDRIKLNYQAITNTKISAEELIEIAKEEIESYKKINQYNGIDSFNLIRLALGCEDGSDNLLGLTLDKLGLKSLKLKGIREKVFHSLENKINELSAGKILVDGYYCTAMTDPVAFCNRIIGVKNSELELQEGEIIHPSESGNRVLYRSPIAYYDEIHQVILSYRDYLKDYSKECIFINEKDDFMMRSSGADEDGDAFAVIKNDILYNNVIKCEYPYYNAIDGITVKMQYNKENYYKAIWLATGNLIGSIAMNNTKLCTECSSYTTLVNTNNEVALYNEVFRQYKENTGVKNPYDKKLNEDLYNSYELKIRKDFKELLKNSNFKYAKEFDEDFKKQCREKLFIRNRDKFFKILQASQSAIDCPKTLIGIPEQLKVDIKKATEGCYKPRFLKNIDKATESEITNLRKNNPMDEFASYVLKECLYPLKDKWKSGGNKADREFYELFGDVNQEPSEALYKTYRQNAEAHNKKNEATKLQKDKADAFTILKLKYLNADLNTIASTAYKYKFTIRFMMKFYGDVLAEKLNELPSMTTDLVEDKDGAILWKGRYYKEVLKKEDAKVNLKTTYKDLIKQGVITRVRVYNPNGINDIIGGHIKVENGYIEELKLIPSGKDKEVIADGEYYLVNYEIDKSEVRASLYLLNLDIR